MSVFINCISLQVSVTSMKLCIFITTYQLTCLIVETVLRCQCHVNSVRHDVIHGAVWLSTPSDASLHLPVAVHYRSCRPKRNPQEDTARLDVLMTMIINVNVSWHWA